MNKVWLFGKTSGWFPFRLSAFLGASDIGHEGVITGRDARRDLEANTMLVTKALSQDVTHLAFVPLAEEAARRSPTGSSALRESEASATKRVAWNGNYPHLKHHNIHKDSLDHLVFQQHKKVILS